ncbi:Uncharacterized protein Fot_39675 [Forsythia ovata]|uniref:Uncharacterized protein n=1 Tax=Forsythia ovata TaxID=205694 RepID=A0ABD1S587_9LAMI
MESIKGGVFSEFGSKGTDFGFGFIVRQPLVEPLEAVDPDDIIDLGEGGGAIIVRGSAGVLHRSYIRCGGTGDLCAVGVQRRDGERSNRCAKDIGEAFSGRACEIETMLLPGSIHIPHP